MILNIFCLTCFLTALNHQISITKRLYHLDQENNDDSYNIIKDEDLKIEDIFIFKRMNRKLEYLQILSPNEGNVDEENVDEEDFDEEDSDEEDFYEEHFNEEVCYEEDFDEEDFDEENFDEENPDTTNITENKYLSIENIPPTNFYKNYTDELFDPFKIDRRVFNPIQRREKGQNIFKIQNPGTYPKILKFRFFEYEIYNIINDEKKPTKTKLQEICYLIKKYLQIGKSSNLKSRLSFIDCEQFDKIIKMCDLKKPIKSDTPNIARNSEESEVNKPDKPKKLNFFDDDKNDLRIINFMLENVRNIENNALNYKTMENMNICKLKNKDIRKIEKFDPDYEKCNNKKTDDYESIFEWYKQRYFAKSGEILLNLMMFMHSPFGIWEPIVKSMDEYKSHLFIDENYQILKYNYIFFKDFNIYRLEEDKQYKHIAVHRKAFIGKGFIWKNGIIVEIKARISGDVKIDENTHICADVNIQKQTVVGKGCTLWNCVTIQEFTKIGDNVIVCENSNIGQVIEKKGNVNENATNPALSTDNNLEEKRPAETVIGSNSIVTKSKILKRGSELPPNTILV